MFVDFVDIPLPTNLHPDHHLFNTSYPELATNEIASQRNRKNLATHKTLTPMILRHNYPDITLSLVSY